MHYPSIICQMSSILLRIKAQKTLKDVINRFTLSEYKVSSKTNRVGMLLDGQKLKLITTICQRISL